MAKRRLGIIASLLCLCIYLQPCAVFAASTTEAKEPVSPDRDCTLTVCYSCDGTAFPNRTVKLYKVAEVSADFQYTLTADFETSGMILNGVQTNSEWDVIRSTLQAHILARNIAPVTSVETDRSGNAFFEALKPGLYLVSAVEVIQEQLHCSFSSALIALPGLDADGYWQYQVTVAAKPEIIPPKDPNREVALEVLKLWKGDVGYTDRPESIEIEIFRNGVSYKMVVLSEDNQWSYSWTAEDDGAEWNVVERNVPSGYTMTVAHRDHTFVITNTRTSDEPTPSPPKTGDTGNILLYTILLYVSGAVLIVLGTTGKRKRHEKTNETDH